MAESIKAVCSLVFIVAAIVTAIVWFQGQPTQATWIARVAAPLVGLLAIGILLKLHLRKDLATDYLQLISPSYFNRDGFCFLLTASNENGICTFKAYFSNQYDQPSVGQIAVRAGKGFWLNDVGIPTLSYQIPCEPGAFGVATIPIPIPQKLQGKKHEFEVGAAVSYPNGKGNRIRFRDGIFLRTNTEFGDAFTRGLAVAGALTFTFIITKPAHEKIELPKGVAEELPALATSDVQTLWKLGDPPLGTV